MTKASETNGCPSLDSNSNGRGDPRTPGTPNGSRDRLRLLVLAALTVGLIALCARITIPFLPAITWGVALAIIAWPLHRWISQHIERPMLSALLSCAAVVVIIVAPGIFVSYQLASEAALVVGQVEPDSEKSFLREKMAAVPALDQVGVWLDQTDVQLETEARKFVGSYFKDPAGVAQGSLATIIQFLVMLFILYYLFLDRGTFVHGLRDLLPLTKSESDTVFARAADSVHANLYAATTTSLIDAIGFGLLFWVFGLPAPLLWGVVMFVLALLPVLGAALVWFPVVAYLTLTDRWDAALALLAWGVTTFIFIDNILYCRLAGQRMRMHAAVTLIAFLGGIAVFGLSGVILGPAILAVTVAFLELWRERMRNGEELAPVASETEIVYGTRQTT